MHPAKSTHPFWQNVANSSRISLWFCILVSMGLVAFTGHKAAHDSFTQDESLTWLGQMNHPVGQIIRFSYPGATTNNHLLNTLLMKACSAVFGNSELSLRLPNWLGHFVYLLFSILIVRQFKSAWLTIPGFILLTVNPYLLDFFSMARGYGLALAFMSGSLFFLLKYQHTPKWKLVAWSYGFCFLAVLANLTWLDYYAALTAGFNVLFIFYQPKIKSSLKQVLSAFLKNNIPALLSGMLLLKLFYEPMKILNAGHEFFFGGNQGFWTDTAFRLVRDSFYLPLPDSDIWGLLIGIMVFLATVLLYLLIHLFRGRNHAQRLPVFIFMIMLLTAGLATWVQHLLFGTLYLLDRTALLFLPLFSMVVLCFAAAFVRAGRGFSLAGLMISLCSAVILFHFLRAANTYSVYEYAYDANTKNMMLALDHDVPLKDRKPDSTYVGVAWVFVPTINFYIESRHMNWVRRLGRYGKDKLSAFDYMYVLNMNDNDRKQWLAEGKRIVAEFPATHTALVKWRPDEAEPAK